MSCEQRGCETLKAIAQRIGWVAFGPGTEHGSLEKQAVTESAVRTVLGTMLIPAIVYGPSLEIDHATNTFPGGHAKRVRVMVIEREDT